MANHTLVFEIWYDGRWNQAPVYMRDGCTIKRGSNTPRSTSDPASAYLTLDNRLGLYSPRSVTSPLYGKIGQNTKARLTVDGSVRLVGEVASWKPERAVKGDAWTKIEVAGVLQRIGRGTDPLEPALTRAITASGPDVFWPLDDAEGATEARSGLGDSAMAMTGTVNFGEYTDLAGTVRAAEMSSASLSGTVPGAATATATTYSVTFGCALKTPTQPINDPSTFAPLLTFYTPGSSLVRWEVMTTTLILGEIVLQAIEPNGLGWIFGFSIPFFNAITYGDTWRYFEWAITFNSATNKYSITFYCDGVFVQTSNGTTVYAGGTQGGISGVDINPQQYNFGTLGVADVWVRNGTSSIPAVGLAADGYTGESAADRFDRVCAEQAIAATIDGDALESVEMGPQGTVTLLGLLDEIALTDDANIIETRDVVGLTMRTGVSKLNQSAVLTLNYFGQIQPPLSPVIGDEGIRNDVTAAAPNGNSRRVQQLTGPHNVQLPDDDSQGVGRYQTRIDVNPATDTALADAAGWRVNLGTFDGTWYAEITADLDAAPGIAALVAAVDIGDLIALTSLPVDEALDTVESIVIGIAEDVQPKRRLVTFYCVPATPYQVGVLSTTSGDTGTFLGHLDTDGSTTSGAIAAGATSFSVATPSGPLWTTVADDFPFDVVVGGQRVSISAISGASSPQTFTVQSTGRKVRYAIAAGSAVNVHQPIILSI